MGQFAVFHPRVFGVLQKPIFQVLCVYIEKNLKERKNIFLSSQSKNDPHFDENKEEMMKKIHPKNLENRFLKLRENPLTPSFWRAPKTDFPSSLGIGIRLLLFVHCLLISTSLSAHKVVPIVDVEKARTHQCILTHPELMWLTNTKERNTSEEALPPQDSQQILGQKFVELDRTLTAIYCLQLILDGSDKAYQEFSQKQSKEAMLSQKSFQELHMQGKKLLQSKWRGISESEMALAMEAALVLGDLGKTEKAREVFQRFGIDLPDHDDFYEAMMQVLAKQPELCPSFFHLPKEAKSLLLKSANLAHYGHISHLEGGASMLEKLRASRIPSTDPTLLDFDLFIHACDVAGALGHKHNKSSLVYTENVHKSLAEMRKALSLLSDPNTSSQKAYYTYLAVRASWLGLNPEIAKDRTLTRIGAMLRLFTPEEGALLKKAMSSFSLNEQEKIIAILDPQKENPKLRTPTYMPALLVALFQNPSLGKTKEERLHQAIFLGIPFICKGLQMQKELISDRLADPNIPLNFNLIAHIVQSAPHLLQQECRIAQDGTVHLAKEPLK